VDLRLRAESLEAWTEPLALVLGQQSAQECVWHGGEEHVLLGGFAPGSVPPGWTVLGEAEEPSGSAARLWLDDDLAPLGGWDHFGG